MAEKEFIEREALIKFIERHFPYRCSCDFYDGQKDCINQINAFPAADVVEVRHGHNATSMHPVDEFLCSVCGFCCADYTETKYDEDGDYTYSCECEFDYCPKCGAKMDGERREDNA